MGGVQKLGGREIKCSVQFDGICLFSGDVVKCGKQEREADWRGTTGKPEPMQAETPGCGGCFASGFRVLLTVIVREIVLGCACMK